MRRRRRSLTPGVPALPSAVYDDHGHQGSPQGGPGVPDDRCPLHRRSRRPPPRGRGPRRLRAFLRRPRKDPDGRCRGGPGDARRGGRGHRRRSAGGSRPAGCGPAVPAADAQPAAPGAGPGPVRGGTGRRGARRDTRPGRRRSRGGDRRHRRTRPGGRPRDRRPRRGRDTPRGRHQPVSAVLRAGHGHRPERRRVLRRVRGRGHAADRPPAGVGRPPRGQVGGRHVGRRPARAVHVEPGAPPGEEGPRGAVRDRRRRPADHRARRGRGIRGQGRPDARGRADPPSREGCGPARALAGDPHREPDRGRVRPGPRPPRHPRRNPRR